MTQLTELSELKICEDDFQPHEITDTTVVVRKIWGDNYQRCVGSIIEEHQLFVKSVGLVPVGVAVTFDSLEDASLFRLFCSEDTSTSW
jgi:hypothetical protein